MSRRCRNHRSRTHMLHVVVSRPIVPVPFELELDVGTDLADCFVAVGIDVTWDKSGVDVVVEIDENQVVVTPLSPDPGVFGEDRPHVTGVDIEMILVVGELEFQDVGSGLGDVPLASVIAGTKAQSDMSPSTVMSLAGSAKTGIRTQMIGKIRMDRSVLTGRPQRIDGISNGGYPDRRAAVSRGNLPRKIAIPNWKCQLDCGSSVDFQFIKSVTHLFEQVAVTFTRCGPAWLLNSRSFGGQVGRATYRAKHLIRDSRFRHRLQPSRGKRARD
jgi:hypothetical protein